MHEQGKWADCVQTARPSHPFSRLHNGETAAECQRVGEKQKRVVGGRWHPTCCSASVLIPVRPLGMANCSAWPSLDSWGSQHEGGAGGHSPLSGPEGAFSASELSLSAQS